jgi:hypothetical protein
MTIANIMRITSLVNLQVLKIAAFMQISRKDWVDYSTT